MFKVSRYLRILRPGVPAAAVEKNLREGRRGERNESVVCKIKRMISEGEEVSYRIHHLPLCVRIIETSSKRLKLDTSRFFFLSSPIFFVQISRHSASVFD